MPNRSATTHPRASDETPVFETRESLTKYLADSTHNGLAARTYLKASHRVIARVTDGIYRRPGSALRELISNAWDADANNVTIHTDAPRFSRIYVRDDGAGMSYSTLARLLHSIGGSAKRTDEGRELGVTSADNRDLSPGGRPLIGKIGIGLFSVSQLSRRFRIVTKVKGENYRLNAEIQLRAHSEGSHEDVDDDDASISADVIIVREVADDIDSHGTDVILDDVKPRVRDVLRTADRWRALDAFEDEVIDGGASSRPEPPKYHVGWIRDLPLNLGEPVRITRQAKLPWSDTDLPEERVARLMDAVESEFSQTARPDLAHTLDAYLEMLWTLGLAVPVNYVDLHPFELTRESKVRLFWLSNDLKGQATEIPLNAGETIREAVRAKGPGHPILTDGVDAHAGEFRVRVDGVELKRPIRFRFAKSTRSNVDHSLLFVGRYAPNLERVDAKQRGGDLALEGYLFWNGRIVPKENNGVLIRIRGASGAAFDNTFFNYQISEQTRLRQITSELFVQEGLDAAQNIDRESFNYAHPHHEIVRLWMHRAIRQLTNKSKDLSKQVRTEYRALEASAARDALTRHAEAVWNFRQGTDQIPEITITGNEEAAQLARMEGFVALTREHVPSLATFSSPQDSSERDAKAVALVRVLAAYDVLADRPYDEQQALVEAILRIFFPLGN